MTGNDIRTAFLHYFEKNGHRVVRSSSLVPAGDPTLLFSNAGMNQFKDVFLGRERRDYNRATSSQKCVRAGGKHNDLENVGRTARHHTFFEMLGNFSFGDYFKEEAVSYAWEFLTQVLPVPADRMVVTIFKGEGGIERDLEAFEAWTKHVPESRIFELGMKDNFWAMGDTGPCGPCSEIHYHQGDHLPCAEEAAGRVCTGVDCECDRWVEIWNLVFMQYNRDSSGGMEPLPAPCVDTGMGLERLTAVLQGKWTNYETDLFEPLMLEAAKIAGRDGIIDGDRVSLRVIADHVRATTFLVADGVIPLNEGRGYVLRKIIRRAARHGKLLGSEGPFLTKLVPEVVRLMGGAYPEIQEQEERIRKVLHREEEGFASTIALGLNKLQEAYQKIAVEGGAIPGEVLFKLYDTFGLPLDLVEDIAGDQGFSLDMEGFNRAMARQKEQARQSWKGDLDTQRGRELAKHGISSAFEGYSTTSVRGALCALIMKDGERVREATVGDRVEIAFDRTPFYAESGGQVGDRGHIRAENGLLRVTDTQKPIENLIIHAAEVEAGVIREGERADLEVDIGLRASIEANHTATHLLHAALREILGTHVKQAGSLVAPSHLRFDFHHFAPLGSEVAAAVEDMVNEHVYSDFPVETEVMATEDAVAGGAMALFGEKYGDSVRVVNVPGFSKELCGGTHVGSTGHIGLFKITGEHSVSSGVRRIEAVTHFPAFRYLRERDFLLHSTSAFLNVTPERVPDLVKNMAEEIRNLEKEVSRLRLQAASGATAKQDARDIKGVRLMTRLVENFSPSEVKNLSDSLREQMGSGVVVIGNRTDAKASLTVALTKDLVHRFTAVSLAKPLGRIIGGGGGGKPDIAEAGGRAPERLQEALDKAGDLLEELV